jgi:putative nucleotidyltransferase with HDIG domain
MERILFVNESRDVLEGIERVLFKMRKGWEMEFVTSGEEALQRLEDHTFHAIVSEAGMHGITGIELMQIVRENYPEMARIIISGNIDIKELLDALGTAHQFLIKPVDPIILKDTLLRLLSLMSNFENKNLKKLINQIQSLPSQTKLHLELLKAISSGSAKAIANIIKKDVAITIKVLQLANSPFLGIRKPIKDILQAVSLLGVDILKGLVLSSEIFSKFDLTGRSNLELEEIFTHCTDVANYAQVISLEISDDRVLANDAYMGGMIHDVGKLILLSNFEEEYFKIKDKATMESIPMHTMEKKILGIDHSHLGAYLLGLWGLPETLIETVAYHHNPGEYYNKQFSPVLSVYIADAVKRHEEKNVQRNQYNVLPPIIEAAFLEELNLREKVPMAVNKIYNIKEPSLSKTA